MSSRRLLAAAYEYDAFGQTQRATGPLARDFVFRFSTKWTDAETGELDYGRRRYSPSLGRFTSRDPIEEKGGVNLYAFVQNNSVSRWDYLGMACREIEIWEAHGSNVSTFYSAGGTPTHTITPVLARSTMIICDGNDTLELEPITVRGSDSPWRDPIVDYQIQQYGFEVSQNPSTPASMASASGGSQTTSDPNNAEEKKKDKTDCEKFAELLAALATPDAIGGNRIAARYAVGGTMLAASYLHGSSFSVGDFNWTKPERTDPTGFRPELTAGNQRSDVYHHVGGHAGAVLVGGLMGNAISWKRDFDDRWQLFRSTNETRNIETRAELAGNAAGRDVGLLMRESFGLNNGSNREELATKIKERLCQ